MSATAERLLTTRDVANRLGVTTDVVRELIRERRLRALVRRVGARHTFRILETDFEIFLADNVLDSVTDDWE